MPRKPLFHTCKKQTKQNGVRDAAGVCWDSELRAPGLSLHLLHHVVVFPAVRLFSPLRLAAVKATVRTKW